MAVVRCEKGHYYDNVKYDECPHCKNGLEKIKKECYADDLSKLEDVTIPLNIPELDKQIDNSGGKTIGVYNFETGTKLIVGWLVCTKGLSRGRDYKLFHGWNRIGRSARMDIYIPEDKKISADNHVAIVFDDKKDTFHIINQQGSLVYLNDESITETRVLKTGDKIVVGDTELIFIAFCTEERGWKEEY